MIHITRFNRRRRVLESYVLELPKRISLTLGVEFRIDNVDSMPFPIVKNSCERGFEFARKILLVPPGKDIQRLTNEHGVFQDMQATPVNVQDINVLKDLQPEEYSRGKTFMGDKGDIYHQVQIDMFRHYLCFQFKGKGSNRAEARGYGLLAVSCCVWVGRK